MAREKNFGFVRIKKRKINFWKNFSEICIHYMSLKIPFVLRWFFEKLALNRDYIRNFSDDLNNPFNLVCSRWYRNSNPGVSFPAGGFLCDLDFF